MRITWFGHSAFRIEMNGAVIMVDPFLSGSPVFEGDPEEAAAGCTHVALTHGHGDHVGDAEAICKRTGAMLISNYEVHLWLTAKGVDNCNPVQQGGTVDCGPFRTTLTVANHSSSGQEEDGGIVYLGNPGGLVFEADGEPTVYHMGDTNMFGDMALIEEFHKPKVGMVPIGDRFTMGGRQAAVACRRFFNFDRIVPCHFGTFPIIDQSADLFVSELADDADKVVAAEIGVPFDV